MIHKLLYVFKLCFSGGFLSLSIGCRFDTLSFIQLKVGVKVERRLRYMMADWGRKEIGSRCARAVRIILCGNGPEGP